MAPKSFQLPEGFVGLPVLVSSQSDIGRLLRELEAVDDALLQASLGGTQVTVPKLTTLMDQTVTMNKLDISNADQRKRLADFLKSIKQSAPVMHFSFSADPTVDFMQKLVSWLRREVHPLVLLSVGLQPNLGAGCVVRSTNKYFDLSLRKDFANNKNVLVEQLSEMNAKAAAEEKARATHAPDSFAAVAAPAAPRAAAAPAQEVHA